MVDLGQPRLVEGSGGMGRAISLGGQLGNTFNQVKGNMASNK